MTRFVGLSWLHIWNDR